MEYLVVILVIIILYILIRTLRVKERFIRTLLSPDVLEVIKTGREAKITFQRNKDDKLRLGDTQTNEKYEYLIFYINAESPNQGIWVQRKIMCNSDKCEFVLKNLSTNLNAVSPLAVLDRGYAIVMDDSGKALTSSSNIKLGETIHTRLANGNLTSNVTKKK